MTTSIEDIVRQIEAMAQAGALSPRDFGVQLACARIEIHHRQSELSREKLQETVARLDAAKAAYRDRRPVPAWLKGATA